MRQSGRLAAEVLDFITPHVKPGVSTGKLDELCHGYILDHGATPAPLNYRGISKVDLHQHQSCGLSRDSGCQTLFERG